LFVDSYFGDPVERFGSLDRLSSTGGHVSVDVQGGDAQVTAEAYHRDATLGH
jgi:hypothetical protein